MARKAIKGYAEKNYYDNTRFNGGIVTSNDTLNEGYFKHLVNFDIADTGQSLTPRKGFLTTTFKLDDNIIIFNNDTIYFYDENLGKYIFFSCDSTELKAYICGFDDIEDNKLTDIHNIAWIDLDDISGTVKDFYVENTAGENELNINLCPITTNRAIRIVDEYNVTAYVIKVKLNYIDSQTEAGELWLKLYYRETGTEDPYDNLTDDTLVVSYLDTSQLVNYVDTNLRNIASSESIIPEPMQEIYKADEIPTGHYDRMPMMYIKQDGKYLINTINNMKDFQVIPNFYVAEDVNTDYRWAYTYEIFSTNKDLDYTDKKFTYKSPIFYIDSGVLKGIESIIDEINYNYTTQIEKLLEYPGGLSTTIADIYNADATYIEYREFSRNQIYTPTNTMLPEYVIYLVPLEDNFRTYDMALDNNHKFGPYGLLSYFDDSSIFIENAGGPIQEVVEPHNYIVSVYPGGGHYGSLLSSYSGTIYNENYVNLKLGESSFYNILDLAKENKFGVYLRKLNDITKVVYNEDNTDIFQNCKETVINGNIFAWETPPIDIDTFMESKEFEEITYSSSAVYFKVLPYKSKVNVDRGSGYDYEHWPLIITGLFPNLETQQIATYYLTYFIGENIYEDDKLVFDVYGQLYEEPYTYTIEDYDFDDPNAPYLAVDEFIGYIRHPFHTLFFLNEHGLTSDYPVLQRGYGATVYLHERPSGQNTSLFKLYSDDDTNHKTLIGDFNLSNPMFNHLYTSNFFDNGLIMNFYMLKVPEEKVVQNLSRDEILTKSAKLSINRQLIRTSMEPTVYTEYLKDEPKWIAKANNSLTYTSLLGSHLVLYIDNKLFISKEGMQYYYTYSNMFEYPEPIVKVIQYKEILLVFTVQNLYAVYLEEVVMEVANGTNEDGSIKYIQQTSYEFRTQTVLYNLMVDKKYADAIQVYNQMVLFYSSDGQMFLIKPTAAITSDTRFSIQYFNKSANDILLNYKDYMQQRLQIYGIDGLIKDVEIKVSATLNYIKIFYNAPRLITYVIVYDILNNRYYVYDTVAFTNVKYLHYIPSGEMYITDYDPKGEGKGEFYFTIPYILPNETDNNVDISYYDNFNPYPIASEIDTGVLNLNNHLKKRFKDLHVIYKNLNANSVEFAIEVFVDDVPIITYIDPRLEIRSILGMDTLVVIDEKKTTQLIKQKVAELIKQTTLFDFTEYTSNKLITHKTNIVSKGKTFRTRLTFSSKGRYKIQGFGIIYKEHTV